MNNVLEDENESNEKIKNIIDIAIKILVGDPTKEAPKSAEKKGFVGQEPNEENPDISYTVHGTHGEQIEIHKVMSTEYDKIIAAGGKYQEEIQ